MIKNIITTINKTIPEVQTNVEYKMAVNRLQQTVDKISSRHSLPSLNYKSFWDFESKVRKTDKKLRGW